MNLHGIVRNYVAAVNPLVTIVIQQSTGSTTLPDGSRVPTYAAAQAVPAQIQSLTYNDIAILDGMSIQGERRAVYLDGDWSGLKRADQRGGDLITFPDTSVWLVAWVLEHWPDWVKLAITRQVAA